MDNRNKLGRFVKGHSLGRKFKKGHKTWNKGLKGICKANAGSFKKGQIAPTKGKFTVYCKCLNCKKVFHPTDSARRKYCSKKCKQSHYVMPYKGKKKPWLANKNSPVWLGGKPKCKDCGKTLSTYSGKTKRCMKCIYSVRIGKNCGHWKGGKTKIYRLLRRKVEFKNWRNEIFKRDNYTCQICNKRSIELHPHHIFSFIDYPELRYFTSNGITVCREHHYLIHKNKDIQNSGWYLRRD
jgi:hypothetical protein